MTRFRRQYKNSTPWTYVAKGHRWRIISDVGMLLELKSRKKQRHEWHSGPRSPGKVSLIKIRNGDPWKSGGIFKRNERILSVDLRNPEGDPSTPEWKSRAKEQAEWFVSWLMRPETQRYFQLKGIVGYVGGVQNPYVLRYMRRSKAWLTHPSFILPGVGGAFSDKPIHRVYFRFAPPQAKEGVPTPPATPRSKTHSTGESDKRTWETLASISPRTTEYWNEKINAHAWSFVNSKSEDRVTLARIKAGDMPELRGVFKPNEKVLWTVIATPRVEGSVRDLPLSVVKQRKKELDDCLEWLMDPAVQNYLRSQGIAGYTGIVRSDSLLLRLYTTLQWIIVPTRKDNPMVRILEGIDRIREIDGTPASPFVGKEFRLVMLRFPEWG